MNPNVEGQGDEVLEYASVHGMTRDDVNKIFRKFCEYDVTSNNIVDVHEFVVSLGLEPEIFLMLVFRLFDSNMEGSVTFCEFMMAYYQFLTLDKDSLAVFTFSLFDLDDSQTLDQEEVELMMRVLEGKVTRNDAIAYKALDIDGDGDISIEEFLIMATRRPNMMFLAFETQMKLRSSCMSMSRWDTLTERRRRLMNDGSKHHNHIGFVEIMGWDPNRKHASSQYAFLALKHIKGLPKGIKAKVQEAESRIALVKRDKQKQRELKERQLTNQRKAITEGKKHQEEVASKYETMRHGNSAGPYDHVGARHTHSVTAATTTVHSRDYNDFTKSHSHHVENHSHHHEQDSRNHRHRPNHTSNDEHGDSEHHSKPTSKQGGHGHTKISASH